MKTCKEPRKLGSLFFGVRSLAQKVRDFIVDFVDRLKQYAVDYAVDQDRTEILAMQSREQDAAGTLERIARTFDLALESAREKAQSGDGAAHSLRKDNEINLSSREYAMFREKIAEIKIGKSAQFPKSANGEYILAIDNKLVYTDGEFVDTHVSQITELNFANETMTDMARGLIFDYEQEGIDGAELQGIIESVFGEGCIKTYSRQDSRGDGRQNGRGKERDYEKVRKNNHGDLSSPEKSREGLNRERFDLSRKEFAQFYDRIAEIKIEKNPQFQNAPDGSYIFDIENKLVYTDGDWEDPTIRRVVSFDLKDGTMLHDAKDFFTELETDGADYGEIKGLLAYVYGKEVVSLRHQDVRDAAEGQDRGRARKDADGAGRDNRADLPSEGKRKFSLKNESMDKVDMGQTLRAGDNSVAEQTEAQEQTRHAPVTVTETMRQWADKRAGQIIREYRSTIDGASVREDMARLVNGLAENSASSDALNATVNMAKGIIEKRYCRKYDDVCAHAHIPIHVSQGTTVGVRQRHDGRMISIHATCGRRPVDTTTLRKIARFQSTLPSRGATADNL